MKFFELLKMPSKNKSKGKANQEVESKASSAEAVALAEPVEATEAIEATTEATIEATTEVDPEVEATIEADPKVEATIEATTINDSNEEKPKESTSKAEPNESPEDIVKNILEKLGLASSDIKPDDKIDTLCVIFKQTLTENVQLKETLVNMNGQLEKNDMTKVALQKLCDALKTQVSLKDEENNLKLQEETNKRIEIAQNFEATMNELTKLIESHSAHNTSLRTENAEMTRQMEALLKEYENREGKISSISEEFRLKSQLYEAQLAKAKIEKAEIGADFNKERLKLQKDLLEANKNIEILVSREENMKEQVELYAAQYDELVNGVDDKKKHFGQFKKQMDTLNKRLKTLEMDSSMWKEKFEGIRDNFVGVSELNHFSSQYFDSNGVVVKLNASKAGADMELEQTKKKLAAMEKLNRTLTAERSQLLKGKKEATENGS